MVHMVSRDNRRSYEREFAQMFEDRKRVFVDWLKWDVPVVGDRYEIDQFDDDEAIYLLDLGGAGRRHLGSVRLLPSTRAHILNTIFPQLCDQPVPIGDDVWEITRLCTSPDLDKAAALASRRQLKFALVEFALIYGITRYTCVSEARFLSQITAAGWQCEALGPQREVDGQMLGAVEIRIDPKTLQTMRIQAGFRAPVLEIVRHAEAA